MHPEYLLELINKARSRKYQLTQLKDKIHKVYKLETQKQGRFKIPIAWSENIGGAESLQYADFRRRYNQYHIGDWLSKEEIKETNNPKLF